MAERLTRMASIVAHGAPSVTGRNTPFASDVENSWIAMCWAQPSQNR